MEKQRKECQICGGTFATNKSGAVINYHGYRKDGHGYYFKIGEGCYGAGKPSYQDSNNDLIEYANVLRGELKRITHMVTDPKMCQDLYDRQFVRTDPKGWYSDKVLKDKVQCNEEQVKEFMQEQNRHNAEYTIHKDDVVSGYVHYHDGKRRVSEREYNARRNISSLERDIDYVEKRAAQWNLSKTA